MILALLFGCSEPKPLPNPDVILVVVDTWRWDLLSAATNERSWGETPNLDALAERGVLFSNAYATAPWTLPSVASILTGTYPTTHGAHGLALQPTGLNPAIKTLAERLQPMDYATLAVTNVSFLDRRFGLDRGFDAFDFKKATNIELRRADVAVDDALALLRSVPSAQPAFLFLHLFDPHLAYDPPKEWTKGLMPYTGELATPLHPLEAMRDGTFAPGPDDLAYMKALYAAEVAFVDHELGRFFAELDKVRPTVGNRIIIVTADHGEEFGDHGGWEHGHSMHHEVTRVPLIVVPPSSTKIAPQVNHRPVSTIDIAPTVLQAVGLPGVLPGQSLLAEGPFPERLVLSERSHFEAGNYSVRNSDWTLIVDPTRPEGRLYSSSDRLEVDDVSGSLPAVQAQLLQRAGELLDSAAALAPTPTDNSIELPEEVRDQLRALGYDSS